MPIINNRPEKSKKSKINNKATELKRSYEKEKGRLSFTNVCDSHCFLHEWQKNELKSLVKCFKKVERLTWTEIAHDPGLKYERNVKNIAIPRPKTLPSDTHLQSLRVDKKKRLFGYRTLDTFNIIWFDKGHIVCPLNRVKKYSV